MRVAVCLALLAAAAIFSVDARKLTQQDALSNSNGCLATIPKCEPGACATRNVMGVARWVCLRCMANYDPVIDASGQDNILQCGEWCGSGQAICCACAVVDLPAAIIYAPSISIVSIMA